MNARVHRSVNSFYGQALQVLLMQSNAEKVESSRKLGVTWWEKTAPISLIYFNDYILSTKGWL
jgi:hypothetical protein